MTATPDAHAALRDGVCNSGEFCVYRNYNSGGTVHDWQPNVGSGNLDLSYNNDYYVVGGAQVGGTVSSARNNTTRTYRIYACTNANCTSFTDLSSQPGVNTRNFSAAPVPDNSPRSHRKL